MKDPMYWWNKIGYIKPQEVHKIEPGHGPCCTCQECGEPHDDCRCDDNLHIELVRHIIQIEGEYAMFMDIVEGRYKQAHTLEGFKAIRAEIQEIIDAYKEDNR